MNRIAVGDYELTGRYNVGPGRYNVGPGRYNVGPGRYNVGPGRYIGVPGEAAPLQPGPPATRGSSEYRDTSAAEWHI